jgi:hypothetical protein
MKHRLSPLGFALWMAAFGLANDACASERALAAAPEFLSLSDTGPQAARWQAIDDDVLAHQSGKNPGASMISGFVLNVLSQWQMPNGIAASAQGSLSVNTGPHNAIETELSTSARVLGNGNGHGNGANPNASTTGGQHVSINGVSQVTQVAGDGNVGMNSAVIDFNNDSARPLGGSKSSSASASNSTGSVKANIAFGNDGVKLTLQTPAGVATQSVATGSTQQAGSIAQLLQIAGNGQFVTNQLQLGLRTQQMSGSLLRQLGVLQALQNTAFLRK